MFELGKSPGRLSVSEKLLDYICVSCAADRHFERGVTNSTLDCLENIGEMVENDSLQTAII